MVQISLCVLVGIPHGCVSCLLFFLVCVSLGGHVCAVPAADAAEPGRIHMHHQDFTHPQLQEWNPADICEFLTSFFLTILHIQFAKVKTSLTPLCLFMFPPLRKHYTNNFLIVLFKGFERIFNRSVCTKGFLKTCFLHENSRHCVFSNTWEMI